MNTTLDPEFSTLQFSLGYLMTRYARTGSAQVASAIIHHLSMLLEHPDLHLYSGANEIYHAMLLQWRDLKAKSTGTPGAEKMQTEKKTTTIDAPPFNKSTMHLH